MPKILVVDDEEDILELAEELFEMANFEVVTKENASEALTLLESGEKVDAIVSDLVMPDMNGTAFFKALKDKGLLVKPFVFVTGYAGDDPSFTQLTESEGIKVFQKPMQIYEIAEYISAELKAIG